MPLDIGGRWIAPGQPLFVVAEIGLNHGGDAGRALDLVDAAAWAGASAIKLQTLVADQLVAPHCPAPAHVRAASLRDFFASFELDVDAHRAIVERARRHGLAVLSTPLAEPAVDLLATLGIDAFKIASGDLTNEGLIARAAATGRPLVISTGMSSLEEIGDAVSTAGRAGASQVALLHCVSAYPAPIEAQNLRAIATLSQATGLSVGLSDHGAGLRSAIAAVALGAQIYERHLVLADDHAAVDRAVSSSPTELREIVLAAAETQLALGDGIKQCLPAEHGNRHASRRGLYATRRLMPGDTIGAGDIVALRPSAPVPPAKLGALIGRRLLRPLDAGEPFIESDLLQSRP